MALDSYSALQSSVAAWLDREDYAPRVPDFIALAEAEFNRRLRVPAMEARAEASTVAASERLPLPSDCLQLKAVTLLANPAVRLEGVTTAVLRDRYGRAWTAQPQYYAVADDQLWLAPIPDAAYTVELVYFRRLTALSTDNPTNWLLEKHPDLYLLASVMQAGLFGWDDTRLPLLKTRVDELIEQIGVDGRRLSWPVQSRISHGVRGG